MKSKHFKNYLLICSLIVLSLSCTPKPPYEIKSPCVANDSVENSSAIHPCIRRPVNGNRSIV
ncbi:MAG: DUF2706 domain-containing protein [Rickettsiales bacterium]|nr:DUF2706 domain-containing protein [Rickettsiales bacterium]